MTMGLIAPAFAAPCVCEEMVYSHCALDATVCQHCAMPSPSLLPQEFVWGSEDVSSPQVFSIPAALVMGLAEIPSPPPRS